MSLYSEKYETKMNKKRRHSMNEPPTQPSNTEPGDQTKTAEGTWTDKDM
jgi:hypothetical protein